MSKRKSNNDEEKVKLSKQNLKASLFIFKYIKPYKWYFFIGMLFLVLGSLIFMIFPGAAGEMTNVAIGEGKYDLGFEVKDYGWIFLFILLAQGLLSYIRTYFFAIVSEKGMADLRKDLYDKIITQSITFFEERRVGELTSRITTDVEQLQSIFSITLAEFLRQIVILISGVIIIAVLTPSLAGLMLLTFPVIVIAAVFFGRYIKKLSKARQDQLAETNSIVEETFQSISVVKAFANEWYESIRYGKGVNEIVKISLKYAKIRGLFIVFIITVLFGGIFFILWQGAILVQAGTMQAGDLFSFILYTGILGGAIASFSSLYTQIVSAIGATERIRAILQSDSEITIEEDNLPPLQIKGDITYENVKFAYPSRPDIEVLKDIDLNIASGQKVAIVGQSGSGKSTIIQLLMKFYNTSEGNILIDNNKIDDFNLIQFRKNIGIVPQEVILFGGTIRENILYGKPNASEEEVITAAKQSNSLEFINSFPEGFDTVVGERGIKLSGGQRQRIAIARAILKDPAILLLDEATSSLDAESERVVQEALDNLMQGRTSIIIAHRLATIKEVDRIYVLENGKIIESGTHDELLENSEGIYSNLAKLQFAD